WLSCLADHASAAGRHERYVMIAYSLLARPVPAQRSALQDRAQDAAHLKARERRSEAAPPSPAERDPGVGRALAAVDEPLGLKALGFREQGRVRVHQRDRGHHGHARRQMPVAELDWCL